MVAAVPSTHDLLDLGDELGIFADHVADPLLPALVSGTAPPPTGQQAQGLAGTLGAPLLVEQPNSAPAAAAPTSGIGIGSNSDSNSDSGAQPLRFPGVPASAQPDVAAAVQAASAAGMPPLPAWEQQQLVQLGSKQSNYAMVPEHAYSTPYQLERLSFKVRGCTMCGTEPERHGALPWLICGPPGLPHLQVFGCHPSQLAADVQSELQAILGSSGMNGYVRWAASCSIICQGMLACMLWKPVLHACAIRHLSMACSPLQARLHIPYRRCQAGRTAGSSTAAGWAKRRPHHCHQQWHRNPAAQHQGD